MNHLSFYRLERTIDIKEYSQTSYLRVMSTMKKRKMDSIFEELLSADNIQVKQKMASAIDSKTTKNLKANKKSKLNSENSKRIKE